MFSVADVATTLQSVLTTTADTAARATKCVKRQGKFTGGSLCQTLVFGWLTHPQATLEQLAQSAAACGVTVSAQGIDQRFTAEAAACLEQVLAATVGQMLAADPVAIPLLARFAGVFVQDSSVISLPAALAALWPGCGNATTGEEAAAVKLGVRLDLCTGALQGPALAAGRTHDRCVVKALPTLPPGSLRLADLGFFALGDLAEQDAAGRYWLTRVQAGTAVFVDGRRVELAAFLEHGGVTPMEQWIELGVTQRLRCRLLAVRVPQQVADQRRRRMHAEARRRGQAVTQERLQLANWTILVTNTPPATLSLPEALVLARARWQIELLFKVWKSGGRIDEWRSQNPWRILCELYAKLIAMVIQHWLTLLGSWEAPNRSLVKAADTVHQNARTLAWSLRALPTLIDALTMTVRCLTTGCRLNRRKKAPNAYQLLLDPSLGGYA